MKWSLQMEGDNRDMQISIKAHKEENDPDFFDGMKSIFEKMATDLPKLEQKEED